MTRITPEQHRANVAVLAGWEAPVPLDIVAGPSFPLDVLPTPLSNYVQALAAFAEVPPDLPGVITLAAVAAAVARKTRISLRPGYSEPLNLFAVVSMPPGTRKSSVFASVTAPLVAHETELMNRMGVEIAEAQSQGRVRDKELAHAETMTAKGGPDARKWDNARCALARTIRETVVPAEPRILMGDATPEAIAAGLADQGGRLAVFSPEGDVFALLKRYTRDAAPNFETLLKAHAGDDLRVDRRHAKPVTVADPALTIAVTVQPDVLQGLARDRTFRERGLLARFFYAVPESVVGRRTFDGPPVPEAVRTRYADALTVLCRWLGLAEPLTVSPDAFTAWRTYALEVERDRGPEGRFAGLLDWTGKLPGLVARLAGILHLATGATAEPIGPQVPAATMDAAIRLGRYAATHALAAFGLMGSDPALDGARQVLGWLRNTGTTTFTKRQAMAARRNLFRTADALIAPLTRLEDAGYIRRLILNGQPGRPSERYQVWPGLAGDGRA